MEYKQKETKSRPRRTLVLDYRTNSINSIYLSIYLSNESNPIQNFYSSIHYLSSLSFLLRDAPIHHQILARDKPGAEEILERLGDVLGHTRPVGRVCFDVVVLVLPLGAVRVGSGVLVPDLDPPRRNLVDADAERLHRHGHALRQSQ